MPESALVTMGATFLGTMLCGCAICLYKGIQNHKLSLKVDDEENTYIGEYTLEPNYQSLNQH